MDNEDVMKRKGLDYIAFEWWKGGNFTLGISGQDWYHVLESGEHMYRHTCFIGFGLFRIQLEFGEHYEQK